MKLGSIEFHIVSDGHVGLDGGAMFGVIPKPLWEKKSHLIRGIIRLALNCLLIFAGGKDSCRNRCRRKAGWEVPRYLRG